MYINVTIEGIYNITRLTFIILLIFECVCIYVTILFVGVHMVGGRRFSAPPLVGFFARYITFFLRVKPSDQDTFDQARQAYPSVCYI